MTRPWRTFVMISIGVFASLLDLFIVNVAFPDLQRDFAGSGLAGLPLGGLLVQASWRWVFLVNLPLGLISIWYAVRRLDESRDPGARGLPDIAGTVALMLGIGALTLALVQGREWGWDAAGTLAAFAAAAVLIGGAVARAGRHPVPVL